MTRQFICRVFNAEKHIYCYNRTSVQNGDVVHE